MQHDYNLANNNGLGFRSDLNQVLLAILTNNSGNAEPTATEAGMWWYDTLTGIIKQRNSTNDGWDERFDMAGGRLAPLASPTFTGAVNLPSTTYIAGSPVARTEAPIFSGNAVFESLTAAMSVSLPALTTIGAVSATELSYLDGVTSSIQSQLNAKQAALVSGINIKTVNGNSLLGSGNVSIPMLMFTNYIKFTSSGTFNVPSGITRVLVGGCGGGGGGGGAAVNTGGNGATYAYGGGGGGSAFAYNLINVTPGSNITVTVGAGGSAGTASTTPAANNGGTGGDSAFGSYIFEGANGGAGKALTNVGTGYGNRGTKKGGGGNGAGAGGDVANTAYMVAESSIYMGDPTGTTAGGSGYLAKGATGVSASNVGNNATANSGAGGSGGAAYTGSLSTDVAKNGGSGGSGVVEVWW